jgi:DNA polymerase-4
MPKMLIDCDAFFASCEQSRNPRLRGKMVVVAGDTEKRSVVTAASYEAKARGVKTGMPIQAARRLVPQAFFVSGDLTLYLDFNLKLYKKLLSYLEPVELYSIDEFYIDHRGSYTDALAMARDFKEWTKKELKITVSVGIAPTKVYAKLASELDKPDGIVVLQPEDIPNRIAHLPVKELFGIGQATEDFLRLRGIHTIGDLRNCQPEALFAELGIRGQWIHDAAMGVNDTIVKVTPDPFKSMGNEMTLPEDTSEPDKIRSFLLFLADTVSHRLRADGSQARTVHLHVRYSDFTDFARSKTMPRPMFLSEHLMEGAMILFKKNYEPGRTVRLLGIGTSNLLRSQGYQLPLFPDDLRAAALARVLDGIREKYGHSAIQRASMLVAADSQPFSPGQGPFAVVPGSGRRPKS